MFGTNDKQIWHNYDLMVWPYMTRIATSKVKVTAGLTLWNFRNKYRN